MPDRLSKEGNFQEIECGLSRWGAAVLLRPYAEIEERRRQKR
jgi:hypothetical protein